MDHEKQHWKKQTRYFTELEQNFSLDPNFYDGKGGQNSFLSQQNSGYGTNFACSSDFDPNMGLQVVPSFDEEVFSDAFFSLTDHEHNGIHQKQSGTSDQPQENNGKLCESLARLSQEREVLSKDEKTDSNLETKTGDIAATGPERRQSDTDSLDVYLKPCVITPTKVEDLYSTLEDEDNAIFQFPPDKATPTCSESNVQGSQENEGLNDSNVYKIQLCSLSHYEALNIESSNDKNLNPCHSNDLFDQKSHCLLTRLNHRLPSRHSDLEPPMLTNNDRHYNVQPFLSNTAEFQESRDYCESNSSNSSSFPPLLPELSTCERRILPPKPTRGKPANICQNVSNERISLDFDEKDHLDMETKDCTSSNKNNRNGSRLRETIKEETQQGKRASTVINVFQEKSKTAVVKSRIRPTATISNEEETETRIVDISNFKRFSANIKNQSCASISSLKKNSSEKDVEAMSVEMEKTSRCDTRMNHNDTEKQRRDQMKSRFESLRQVVPGIEKIEKTPKVQILKQAWKYIRYLEEEEQTLERIKTTEKEKNQKLLKELQNIVN